MTVATLNDVLLPAIAGRYAVAGLVVLGWEDAKAFVEAAEETGLPVMVCDDPISAVVLGSGKALDHIELLKEVTIG